MTTPFTYLIVHQSGQWYYGVRYAEGCSPTDLWDVYFTSSALVQALLLKDGVDAFRCEIRRTFSTPQAAINWEHRVLKRILGMERCLNQSAFPAVTPEARHRGHVTKAQVGVDGLTSYQRAVATWKDKRDTINPYTGNTFETDRKIKSAATRSKASPEIKVARKKQAQENVKRMHTKSVLERAHSKVRMRVADGTFPTTKGRKFPSISEKLKGKQFTLGLIWVNDGTNNHRIKPNDPRLETLTLGRLIATGAASKGYKQPTLTCHCGVSGAQTNMKRYHFANCKATIGREQA